MSKAIEGAAAATKKVAEVVESAGNFVGRIVGPPADQLSGLLSDQLRFWRARNLNRIAEMYDRLRSDRPWHPDAVRMLPFGISVQALEKASAEEDETLQMMWARFFVNATDPNKDVAITKIHTDVLASLTAVDAHMIDLMWAWENPGTSPDSEDSYELRRARREQRVAKYSDYVARLDARAIKVSIHNLKRLQVIDEMRGFDPFTLSELSLNAGYGGAIDTSKLEKVLAKMADNLQPVELDVLMSRYLEHEPGTGPSLCRYVLNYYTFTALGEDFMKTVEQ